MKKQFYLFFVLLIGQLALAQDIDFEEAEDLLQYQEWVEEARQDSSLLFVVLWDKNDIAWQRMEAENVFENTAFIASLQSYKALQIPIASSMGARWVQLFPANQLPAFYFLQGDELLLQIRSGYQTAEQLREAAQKARSLAGRYETLSSHYGDGSLSTSQWKDLLYLHSLNFPFNETLSLALEFLNSQNPNQLMSDDVLPLLVKYGVDLETPYPEKVIQNQKSISGKLPDFNFNDFIAYTYSYNLDLAVASEDSVLLNRLLEIVVPLSKDSLVKPSDLRFETQKLYAEETGQFSILRQGVMEYTDTIQSDSLRAEAIFDYAFAVADEYNTKPALTAARKMAARANVLHESFRYRMLEGYMAYLLQDYEEAERLVTKAAGLTNNPNNQRKAEGLMQMIVREKADNRD